ncbi:DUF3906 family protein [Halalkalibacter kiskunsagensis]|uniref:DUF3906 family protein n=1 Tax=Halalkalibacter kiskunsagensis TaxID=1548599 RepID=A0ABV6KNM6_9BACI
MMQLFRFEVETDDERTLYVVVVAANEEAAFTTAEMEVEKHYLKLPTISSITLLEKKPVRKSTGFVVE